MQNYFLLMLLLQENSSVILLLNLSNIILKNSVRTTVWQCNIRSWLLIDSKP